MKKFILGIAVGAMALSALLFSQEIVRVTTAWAANAACNVDNCQEQGGGRWSVGGSIDVLTGGDLDMETGSTFKIAGVTMSSTAAELNLMDGVTATTAEINQAADESANVEVVAATNAITAAESGATFFLNDATEFVSTLPAVAAGLRYKFIVTAAPASASYTIVTPAGADLMAVILTAGGIDDASDVAVDRDVITFVDAQAVVGDWVECISDGTKWFCQGSAAVAAGITTGQS